ncbi:YkyA family protein [Paenisporosarcina antarctica]|uniref:Cell-wall binding lipoprotein n=1 Tax=Paenisporosarcina antarctica TaxID=417367 RepID=A0A4P6ZZ40_9BACL|nr:YkyA family protein [Paenisporosarcina antarctica]QBP41603.1 hypothetical protein E2636_10810 [Paenisporosarcina antarctica]
MKKIVIGTFLSTSIILSACSIGVTTEEKLSETLATIYEEEQGYRDAQQQLTVLEKKEQSTFNSSMELTQEQQEEVSIKVEELKSSLMERLTLLNEENESIESALASISSFDSLIDEVKEEEIKTTLIDLKSLIETRYQAHDVVSKEYQKLTDLQTVLYDMLVDEETEQAQLQEQVLKVNEQNDIVQSSINEFNEATIELNELKVSIYDALDEK